MLRSLSPALLLLAIGIGSGRVAGEEPPRPGFTTVDSPAGIGRYVPGRWGMVGVGVKNPTDQPGEFLVSMYFEGSPQVQYGARLWTPPRARRTAAIPVLVPTEVPGGREQLGTKSVLLSGPNQPAIKTSAGQVFQDGVLRLEISKPVTGILADAEDADVREVLFAARNARQLSHHLAELQGPPCPPSMELLDGLDQLVIASDRLAADPAGWQAVRHWLHDGGRLWIMLDKVSPETVSLLLGDAWRCAVVDRVGLTQVAIEESSASGERFTPPAQAFEKPVDLVRVVGQDLQATHRVNEWPAAWIKRAGKGYVFFTTLGARGWLRPRTSAEVQAEAGIAKGALNRWPATWTPRAGMAWPGPRISEAPWSKASAAMRGFTVRSVAWMQRQVLFPMREWLRSNALKKNPPRAGVAKESILVATDALEGLAARFLEPREPQSLEPVKVNEYVTEQVGYQVVGRGVVLAVLGGFCLTLAVCGVWLVRVGKPERLAWIGPGLAVAAFSILLVAGERRRASVPTTIAAGQLAEIDPAVDEARISGILAVYHQQTSGVSPGVERGGNFALDLSGLEGATRRMVWTDFDKWHLENLSLPPGFRTAPFSFAEKLDRRVRARATFGPEGLAGTLEPGPFTGLHDAILTTGNARALAVRLDADGRFVAGRDDLLGPGQHLGGVLLSDRQQQMQAINRAVIENQANRRRFRASPTLLVWAAPRNGGFCLAEDAERVGDALLTVPLSIERPPSKSAMFIPSPFLPYRAVAWPGESGPSPAFSNRDGVWVGPLAAPTQTLLSFQCPREMLPLQGRHARLTLGIKAPSRRVEVSGLADGSLRSLATAASPIGTLQFSIDRADVLRPDGNGDIRLGISVGPSEGETGGKAGQPGWKIEEVELELTADAL